MAVPRGQIVEVRCDECIPSHEDVQKQLSSKGHALLKDCSNASTRLTQTVETVSNFYEPRGVYKVYNPAICTLPPKYTEPAIKLVGTMMVFHGKTVFDQLNKAAHCALIATTLTPAKTTSGENLAEPQATSSLDKELLRAARLALAECAADHVTAAIVAAAMEDGLYTDERLTPGTGDFPTDSRSQFVFYTQSEKQIGLKLDTEGELLPRWSTVGVVGLFDPSNMNRRRACGRCKFRAYCSIRAIGMTCHGRKDTLS